MEAVPVTDPVPSPANSMKRRFWRIFRLLALLSFVVAAIAVVLVSAGDPTLHVNMLVATALGVFCTMLLGTSLMSLIFISAESGHDEAASGQHQQKDNE
ncbi:MAG TPA: hypothetical protein VHE36_10635 [Sphingomicrobium sp.]|jgi:hypothetical protein|nr:hypothetical protein [Sphingomicrobium sp.]